MKKDEINHCMQIYLSARGEGKDPYFDVGQLIDMLDSLEESYDMGYFNDIVDLGLRLHPGNPDLLIKKCRALIEDDDIDKAREIMDALGDYDDENLHLMRMECYCYKKQYQQIVSYMQPLVQEKADCLLFLFENLAVLCNNHLEPAESEEFIRWGLELFPDSVVLKEERCCALEQSGRYEEAIKLCNELIDKNPYSYTYWYSLGRYHLMSSDVDKAIEAFDFALACSEELNEEVLTMKAYSLMLSGSYEKALEVYRLLEEHEFSPILIYPHMGECYTKLGDFEQGYIVLKKMLDDHEKHMELTAYYNLASCSFQIKKPNDALNTLYRALKRYPEELQIWSLITVMMLQMQLFDSVNQSFPILFHLAEQDARNPEKRTSAISYLMDMGLASLRRGQMKFAERFFHKAVDLDPDHVSARSHLVVASLLTDDPEQAQEHMAKLSLEDLLNAFRQSDLDPKLIDTVLNECYAPKSGVNGRLVKQFLTNKDNSN